jgi:hypothetical protein
MEIVEIMEIMEKMEKLEKMDIVEIIDPMSAKDADPFIKREAQIAQSTRQKL